TDVVSPGEAINEVRRSTRALKLKPERGSPFLLGGVDVAIDCVGSKGSLDLALRTTKAGGRVVLAGIPVAGVDLTPLWFRELELEVDERTPPLLVHEGEGFQLQKFPLGSRVIYPPDALPGIKDVRGAIRRALAEPHDAEPLEELLKPGMKLTIAFDDISIPLPPMQEPDIRQLILEEVIELAAAKGVEDLKLIVANSLHRRMTGEEIKHAVGERVFRSFYPRDLTNHDAEDHANLTYVGTTDKSEDVGINKRAVESKL